MSYFLAPFHVVVYKLAPTTDFTIYIVNNTGLTHRLIGHTEIVLSVLQLDDGRLLSTSKRYIIVWDLEGGTNVTLRIDNFGQYFEEFHALYQDGSNVILKDFTSRRSYVFDLTTVQNKPRDSKLIRRQSIVSIIRPVFMDEFLVSGQFVKFIPNNDGGKHSKLIWTKQDRLQLKANLWHELIVYLPKDLHLMVELYLCKPFTVLL